MKKKPTMAAVRRELLHIAVLSVPVGIAILLVDRFLGDG